MNNFYSVKEAAEKLGVSAELVKKWCQRGKLSAFKVGAAWVIPAVSLKNPPKLGKAGRPKKERS